MLRSLMLAVALSSAACSNAPHGSGCSADNCQGCCTSDGACKPGTDPTVCGSGGFSCDICADTQFCSATSGRCEMTVVDAGPVDAGPPLCAKTPSPCSDQAIQ